MAMSFALFTFRMFEKSSLDALFTCRKVFLICHGAEGPRDPTELPQTSAAQLGIL